MKARVAAFSLLLAASSLWATGTLAAKAEGFIGAGAGFSPDYEGSDDSEAGPALFGRYTWASGRYVKLGGSNSAGGATSLRANLISESMSPVWRLGPVIQYRPERDDVDNNRVDRLSKVDNAVELGIFGGIAMGPWTAHLTIVTDVSDEHDGYLATLNGAYAWKLDDRLTLKLGAAATYADSDYMDTYFSIDTNDAARSGLREFDADSGLKDIGFTLRATYGFGGAWGVLGSLSYFRMLGDAEDSPVVDDAGDNNQFGGAIALTYSF